MKPSHRFKHLISSGCSFTEGHNLLEKGSWAYYLAKKLDLNLINLGKGGSGNEVITQRVINYASINKETAKDSLFVIQLSECLRYLIFFDDYFTQINNGQNIIWHITPHEFLSFENNKIQKSSNGFDGWDMDFGINKWIYDNREVLMPLYTNITFSLSKTYDSIINFINFCEANNYPYIIFDGINNHIPQKQSDGNYYLMDSGLIPTYKVDVSEVDYTNDLEYFKNLNIEFSIHKNTIDLLKNNKRYLYNEPLCYFVNTDEKYTEGNEGHPNELASEIWAEKIKTKLLELKDIHI